MQATLTEDHLWRGQTYPAGDREIPEELAIALGLTVEGNVPDPLTFPIPDVEPLGMANPAEANPPDLLAILNDAELADDLVYLPTIGKAAAAVILLNRPFAGYESLEEVRELNHRVTEKPFRVDWVTVREFVESATVADLEG
jgi:hypothetical protein